MEYKEIESLEKYLFKVEAALLNDEGTLVSYPKKGVNPWDYKMIDDANKEILEAVSDYANVYAIFTAPKNSSTFSLRYIGKTTRKLARQRIRNHLIKQGQGTGAQFKKIISHVKSGGKVKISWVRIEPESLRNYLEEELINRSKKVSKADWNQGKVK
jgi:hypothetical protein